MRGERPPPVSGSASVIAGARRTQRSDARTCDLVVITGFSGAGKSTAMAVFEDAGYFCVDNLPPEMIGSLAELFMHEGSKVERAAVVCDVRGGGYFDGLLDRARRARRGRRPAARDLPRRRRADAARTATRRPAAGTRSRRPGASRTASPPSARCSARCASAPIWWSTPPGCRARRCGAALADELLATAAPAWLAVTFTRFGHKHGASARPTSRSTCASCRTRTTRPSCARYWPRADRPASTSVRDGQLEEFYAG